MTATDGDAKLLKTDALGRVRTPATRREQLLDEFERSGTSGVKFAELTGLKYQTLATWVQQRRRQRQLAAKSKATPPVVSSMHWLEAVVEKAPDQQTGPVLSVQLPGGAQLEISCAQQIPLAVALLRALEKPAASC